MIRHEAQHELRCRSANMTSIVRTKLIPWGWLFQLLKAGNRLTRPGIPQNKALKLVEEEVSEHVKHGARIEGGCYVWKVHL